MSENRELVIGDRIRLPRRVSHYLYARVVDVDTEGGLVTVVNGKLSLVIPAGWVELV